MHVFPHHPVLKSGQQSNINEGIKILISQIIKFNRRIYTDKASPFFLSHDIHTIEYSLKKPTFQW
jgi:hypothetical protein